MAVRDINILEVNWIPAMTDTPRQLQRRDFLAPFAVALAALLAVVLTLDAAGDYPKLFEGPGITLDESFNVQMGVYQWKALRDYNLALLHPDSVREVFGTRNYNPDHPPLGRVWLGFWHDLVEWLFPPNDHPVDQNSIRFVTDCARVGSATAFALTVLLIGVTATKWYGRTAGIVAAISLVLMPRVFAHAHLASLETFLNLTYSATVLAVAHWWRVEPEEVPRSRKVDESLRDSKSSHGVTRLLWWTPALTGVLFGLALLSKMQAILIPPVVGVWALWHWRVRAIKPLAIFGLVGLFVFFVGWPWLWLDPVQNFREYFARTTSRAVLNCYYLGQVWADKDVPWHYSFVMFAVTVPIGLHLLGVIGAVAKLTRSASAGLVTPVSRLRFGFVCGPREQLVLAATLFPLVLFALPGVAVYDGERLFLISYPMWAVLIGRGAELALSYLKQTTESGRWRLVASGRARGAAITLFLLAQSVGVIVMHPCQLSYYNLLVGGLYGADRLGFERTYWGDSVTRSLLTSEVSRKEGGSVEVWPVLHQFQLDELLRQSPILRNRRIQLLPANSQTNPGPADGWLYFSRKADVPPDVWNMRNGIGVVRQGVRLAAATGQQLQ